MAKQANSKGQFSYEVPHKRRLAPCSFCTQPVTERSGKLHGRALYRNLYDVFAFIKSSFTPAPFLAHCAVLYVGCTRK